MYVCGLAPQAGGGEIHVQQRFYNTLDFVGTERARYLVVVQAAAQRETLQHNEVESNQLQKGGLNTKEGRMHNRLPTKKWRPGKTIASGSALPLKALPSTNWCRGKIDVDVSANSTRWRREEKKPSSRQCAPTRCPLCHLPALQLSFSAACQQALEQRRVKQSRRCDGGQSHPKGRHDHLGSQRQRGRSLEIRLPTCLNPARRAVHSSTRVSRGLILSGVAGVCATAAAAATPLLQGALETQGRKDRGVGGLGSLNSSLTVVQDRPVAGDRVDPRVQVVEGR